METVTDFIFMGDKITIDGECSHEIKRCLLLGRKAITNQDSILKSRDRVRDRVRLKEEKKKIKNKNKLKIKKQRHDFANKGPSSQSYAFSNSHVWM